MRETMGKVKSLLILGVLIVGVGGSVRLLTTPATHAGGSIEVPGTLTDLPQANGVTYEGPRPASEQLVTTRQALDAAEKEFGLTDTQIDPTARVVPAIVSVGLSPQEQHMSVLVVTANVDLAGVGR